MSCATFVDLFITAMCWYSWVSHGTHVHVVSYMYGCKHLCMGANIWMTQCAMARWHVTVSFTVPAIGLKISCCVSCHTCMRQCILIMAHVWASHVTHMNQSHHTYTWRIRLFYIYIINRALVMRYRTLLVLGWRFKIHRWRYTRIASCSDIYRCPNSSHTNEWHSAPWRMHMCDVTGPCVWHDSFICAPWQRRFDWYMYDTTHITLL